MNIQYMIKSKCGAGIVLDMKSLWSVAYTHYTSCQQVHVRLSLSATQNTHHHLSYQLQQSLINTSYRRRSRTKTVSTQAEVKNDEFTRKRDRSSLGLQEMNIIERSK